MTIVADTYRFVVGVDTHVATHHYAVVDTNTGGVVGDAEFPTHAKGLWAPRCIRIGCGKRRVLASGWWPSCGYEEMCAGAVSRSRSTSPSAPDLKFVG